jgi:hypothetical protein
MKRARPSLLAACLLSVMASACSQTGSLPKDFTLVDQRADQAKETGNTLEAAERICKTETTRKGIGSIAGIFSRLRKGAAEEDYGACMKRRGYEVKS